MITSQAYIATAIVILIIIALLIIYVSRSRKVNKFTPLASFAFIFILAGAIFGDDRLIGYVLMGIGVFLAIIDIVLKLRK